MNSKQEIDNLCQEHIKLVGFIMNKEFKRLIENYPYLMDDLYQEGSLGLFDAAKKYDKSKGAFSTIACVCIRNRMKKFYVRYIRKHYDEKCVSLNKDNGEDKETTLEGVLELNIVENVDYLVDKEELESIRESIENCGVKDIKEIVKLRLKNCSQVEIGEKLGYSQVQVSRKLKELYRDIQLKKRLKNILERVS